MATADVNPGAPEGQILPLLEGGLAVLDADGVILEANSSLAAWLGRREPELAGQSLVEVLSGCCAGWREAWTGLDQQEGTFSRDQWTAPGLGGEAVHRYEVELTRHRGGKVFRLSSISDRPEEDCERCLSARPGRREAFFRLVRASEQLQQLMQRWPGVVFSQRPDGAFYFVSPKIEELTGVPAREWEKHPERFWQVIHEADLAQVQQRLQRPVGGSQSLTSTFRIRHLRTSKVGYILEHRQAVMTSSGLLLGYEGVWLDLTRQTLVEKRLNAAAWKETLSALTLGLAHDFRNIMTGIIGLTETFQAQLPGDHGVQAGLALIRTNAWQATQSIQRILQLYQGRSGENSYANLNELVQEMVEMTKSMLSRLVRVDTHLADGTLPLYLDTFEFRQAFLNLAVNARDAMPQGGRLTITTSRHESIPELKQVQGTLPRLPAICLTISDSGTGIAPEHLSSLFDPFFTTKGPDKGSGLGLYNVLLFVEKQRGAVSVESTMGEGATFRLWLPEADFTEADKQVEEHKAIGKILAFGPRAQPMDSMAELLRQEGFEVVVAHEPEAALELVRSPLHQFAGALMQTTAKCPTFFADIRKGKLPVKTILQVVGCNEDEVESSFLLSADLVLSPEMTGREIPAKVRTLLESAGGRK